jgi:hypothetical protein
MITTCTRCFRTVPDANRPCPHCGANSFELSGALRPPVIEGGAIGKEAAAQQTKDTNPKDAVGDKKAPLHLCSPIAMLHWALAQFAGLLKYGAWNWRPSGVRASVYIAAMKRHIDAYSSGEQFDPVDGSHHLGNVMACCAILLEAEAAGNLTDDRPPVLGHRSTLEFVEKQMEVLRAQYADRAPRHYTIADKDHLPKL